MSPVASPGHGFGRDAACHVARLRRTAAAGKGGCGVGRGRLVTERRRAAGVRRGAAARIITSRRRGARGPPRCSAAMHRRAASADGRRTLQGKRCSASASKSTTFPAGCVLARASNGPCPDTLRAFSCPDDRLPWHFVRTTHTSVPRHRIACSGLAIESNRLCDVDRNRSGGAGGLRKFRVRPNPKCPGENAAMQPASDRAP